jgi:hypothetical protein
MEKLIEALQIFLKYGNPEYPTHCEHDVLYVYYVKPQDVSEEDIAKLDELGFHPDKEFNCFKSFRYGSC